MFEEKIEVIAYSGYRGEETPRTIFFRGKTIGVNNILDQWMEEKFDDRTRKRLYQFKGSDGVVHRIYYDEKSMEWFYILKD